MNDLLIPVKNWEPPVRPITSHQQNVTPISVTISPHIENKNRQDSSMALLTGFVIGLAAAWYITERKDNSPPHC